MEENKPQKRILELEDLQKIDLILESFYPKSKALASQMKGLDTSQIRKLETLVASTRRFSEIINFIKNQAGKKSDIGKEWSKIATQMIEHLEKFEEKARTIEKADPERILAIKVRLARGWVKQVVCHYLYVGT